MSDAWCKSCLSHLAPGHKAVVAVYDKDGECIIKSCMPKWHLFQNKCYSKTEYDDLIKQEKICKDSGGVFQSKSLGRVCVCPEHMFEVNKECKLYDSDDCESKEVMISHIKRNKYDAVKKCVQKNKDIVKGVAKDAIDGALKTNDYKILDFLLDNGLDLEEKTWIGSGNTVSHAISDEVLDLYHDIPAIDLVVSAKENNLYFGEENIRLMEHLITRKNISLTKKYTNAGKTDFWAAFVFDYYGSYNVPCSNGEYTPCTFLDFLLAQPDFDDSEINVLTTIMKGTNTKTTPHLGFPIDYLKYARSKGLKFKIVRGTTVLDPDLEEHDHNPMDFISTASNMQKDEYHWLITEIQTDIPDVDFTQALEKFCRYDYIYGPPPRTLQQDKDIIEQFLNAGAKINDKTIKGAKDYQNDKNKNCGNGWPCSHKFEAVCSFAPENSICTQAKQALQEKQDVYEKAKATEQSKENRMLTAATVAATGIGGMELAQGLAEQKADKAAAEDMAAYINTMRCTYGKGKSVKAGSEEIELPGGNSDELMKLRNEYFALAADLKARKEALGMKPGIESEEILDKAQLDLYSQENTGITDGAYASLYRSQMLGSEKDKSQIDEDAKKSKNRVIGGGVAAGVGVVGGAVGDSLINGKK